VSAPYRKFALIATYLAAIVAANQLVNGHPSRAPFIAFALIGWDLVARDRLHLYWTGQHLWRNMAFLIGGGSLISAAVNPATTRIAIASCVAFGVAATVDTIVFHIRRRDRWEDRSMLSNTASAAVDSFVFPLIAFVGVYFTFWSSTFWTLVFTLFCAKVAGSWLWVRLLRKRPVKCDVPGCKIEHVG
jgi:hypothetical protein